MNKADRLAAMRKDADKMYPNRGEGRPKIGKTRGEKLEKSKYNFLWKTADKRWLALEEMDTNHLVNSLRMLARSSRESNNPIDRRAYSLIKELENRKDRTWTWKAADQGFIGYNKQMKFFMVDKCPLCKGRVWDVVKDSSGRDRLQCLTGDYTMALERTVDWGWDYLGEDSAPPMDQRRIMTNFGLPVGPMETEISNGSKRKKTKTRNKNKKREWEQREARKYLESKMAPRDDPEKWAMEIDEDDNDDDVVVANPYAMELDLEE